MRHDGGVASFIPNKSKNMEIICNIWGDVATFVPKVIYDTFGCMEDVKPYYAMMKSWVEYMRGVDEANGEKIYSLPFQFGDWLGLDGITEQSSKGGTDDDFLGLLYYYRSTVITANMAGLLGKKDDEKQYNSLAEKIRKDILHEYFSPSGRLVCDTQAAYIVALAFDVYIDRDKLIGQFMERLKKDCYNIKCGFVGAPLLCTTLAKIGFIKEAYNFLFKEDFPSWLYCVNLGATTIWERWNSILPDGSISGTGMNSLNHYSYGTIVQFIYEHSAGLKALEPGFSYALIAPEPDMRLKNLECSLMTASGKYVSDWTIEKDGFVNIHVEIPFGAKARVKLPRFDKASKESLLAKEVLKISLSESGEIELCTGCYDFKYMPCEDYRFIYSPKTRLFALRKDKEAMEILKNELPIAYGYVMDKDVEVGNTALGDLKYLIYRGFAPGSVPPVVEKIYALNRYEIEQA